MFASSTDIVSIGTLASDIGEGVASVKRAAGVLGIEPIGRIDGVVYFDRACEERIDEYLKGQRKAKR